MKSTNQVTNTVEFHGVQVTVIDHEGKQWLTALDVGRCLGYTAGKERLGVMKVYERHNDEFTGEDSTVVKLTTVDGKLRDVRVFSQTGCIKLGFFANSISFSQKAPL